MTSHVARGPGIRAPHRRNRPSRSITKHSYFIKFYTTARILMIAVAWEQRKNRPRFCTEEVRDFFFFTVLIEFLGFFVVSVGEMHGERDWGRMLSRGVSGSLAGIRVVARSIIGTAITIQSALLKTKSCAWPISLYMHSHHNQTKEEPRQLHACEERAVGLQLPARGGRDVRSERGRRLDRRQFNDKRPWRNSLVRRVSCEPTRRLADLLASHQLSDSICASHLTVQNTV